MIFITNTDAAISLNGCTFKYGSNIFLKAAGTSEWGKSGSNGGDVTLTLTNQNIEGDFVVDNDSELVINMVNSTIKGTINGAKTADILEINMDANSKITLTGNSYYTKLNNAVSNGNNIDRGSYSFSNYDDDDVKRINTSSSNYYYNISIIMFLLLSVLF